MPAAPSGVANGACSAPGVNSRTFPELAAQEADVRERKVLRERHQRPLLVDERRLAGGRHEKRRVPELLPPVPRVRTRGPPSGIVVACPGRELREIEAIGRLVLEKERERASGQTTSRAGRAAVAVVVSPA